MEIPKKKGGEIPKKKGLDIPKKKDHKSVQKVIEKEHQREPVKVKKDKFRDEKLIQRARGPHEKNETKPNPTPNPDPNPRHAWEEREKGSKRKGARRETAAEGKRVRGFKPGLVVDTEGLRLIKCVQ